LKISARNQMGGTVKEVTKGMVTTSVKIAVDAPVTITAVITKEAAEELDLKPDDKVYAVVKATDVMISKE
jgi:molybdopterin-binding protein